MVDISILPIVAPMFGGVLLLAIGACCCAVRAKSNTDQMYVRLNNVEEVTNRIASQQYQQQQQQQPQQPQQQQNYQQFFPPSYYPTQPARLTAPAGYTYMQPQASAPPVVKVV